MVAWLRGSGWLWIDGAANDKVKVVVEILCYVSFF